MDQYCVVGNPIKHSLSPFIHTYFAKNTSQDLVYDKRLVELNSFPETILAMFKDGLRGCNVTVPFKELAYSMCDELTERAKMARSVNTLRYDDGKISGDNTDGIGLVRDLTERKHVMLANKNILVLGAGGAAKGIVGVLLQQKINSLVISNRTYSKAELLANQFAEYGTISAVKMNELSGGFDVVINATSSSIGGNIPEISTDVIKNSLVAYDLMYGLKPTAFQNYAVESGIVGYDGLGMLVEQAAESFYFWRGMLPKTNGLTELIRSELK